MTRRVDTLTAQDFAEYPVWRYTDTDEPDETYLSPVREWPVETVDNCLVGCAVRLASGCELQGFVRSLDLTSPHHNAHFLALSVFRSDGAVFHLARYHDLDAHEHGPASLADFLGLPLAAVFPISFDASHAVAAHAELARGSITAEPAQRLTRAELIALAVP
jgi:hypothetical protein